MKNGKWCCSPHWNACPKVKKNRIGKKRSDESKKRMSESHKNQEPWNKGLIDIYSEESRSKMGTLRYGSDNPFYNKKHTDESKKKMSEARKGKTYEEIYGGVTAIKIIELRKGKTYEEIYGDDKAKEIKEKQSNNIKNCGREYSGLTISLIHTRYPFFSKIEEMRYNPNNITEIQVRCKNHNCPNSKEQSGWFTPTYIQLYERIRQLEKDYGNDGCYFYCCDECKQECPLYHYKGSDPFKDSEKSYNQQEYQQFREFVLKRDNYKCQYCGNLAEHVHHERPQKIEPFFTLDPFFAWSVCKKCHYKYGHKDECSTGRLANVLCK
jgi:5-methylcytosine-specific restriction endonuclease McrA